MATTRRSFVRSLSFTIAAANLSADSAERLRIAFSTLGCPDWKWNRILDYATAHNFAAIELRGLEGNLDLPSQHCAVDQVLSLSWFGGPFPLCDFGVVRPREGARVEASEKWASIGERQFGLGWVRQP